eukprot:978791_1
MKRHHQYNGGHGGHGGRRTKFLLSSMGLTLTTCSIMLAVCNVNILTDLHMQWLDLGQDDGLSGQSKAQFLRERGGVGASAVNVDVDVDGSPPLPLVDSKNDVDNGNNNGNSGEQQPVRKWAYAFLAGGCSREKSHHTGFIANIAVAAAQLQSFNSTADVVALIQMSHSSKHDTLSEEETRLLQSMPNVKIQYLPKYSSATHEMFYNLMMEKFRVLDLTDYSRVIFMDGDVMPLASMDYLFELSEPLVGENNNNNNEPPPVLMENLILSWAQEPAHGGFFMLKPNHDDYLHALEIIHNTEVLGLDQPWPHFDEVLGFGHKIDPSDPWESNAGMSTKQIKSTNWTWHGSFADQGFLYHWVKFVKKNVSIINGPRIDNYFTTPDQTNAKGELILQKRSRKDAPLTPYSAMYGKRYVQGHGRDAPKVDFAHFLGSQKPWYQRDRTKKQAGTKGTWFSVLETVEKLANVTTIQFPDGKKGRAAPVGAYPVFAQRRDSIKLKAENNWTMYA